MKESFRKPRGYRRSVSQGHLKTHHITYMINTKSTCMHSNQGQMMAVKDF